MTHLQADRRRGWGREPQPAVALARYRYSAGAANRAGQAGAVLASGPRTPPAQVTARLQVKLSNRKAGSGSHT